jgi:hypothetical protein
LQQLPLDEGPVWVLDTSALVNFKVLISAAEQWQAFRELERLVEQGRIAMPRQVIREASEIAHPDVPGAWAAGVRSRLLYPLDADYGHVQRVMRDAGDVLDPNKATEDADPYVLALALQIQAAGRRSVVVTDDEVDRAPIKISMATACSRLGVDRTDSRTFLSNCGINVLGRQSGGSGVPP